MMPIMPYHLSEKRMPIGAILIISPTGDTLPSGDNQPRGPILLCDVIMEYNFCTRFAKAG